MYLCFGVASKLKLTFRASKSSSFFFFFFFFCWPIQWSSSFVHQFNIEIKHGFHALTFASSRGRCWKPRPKAEGQHLTRDLENVNALKNHVRSLLLHKNWKHLLNFALFFALFCFAFSQMSRESNFRGLYARSRTGQYTSRNGSKSVAPVRSYWKLCSRALTACELPC